MKIQFHIKFILRYIVINIRCIFLDGSGILVKFMGQNTYVMYAGAPLFRKKWLNNLCERVGYVRTNCDQIMGVGLTLLGLFHDITDNISCI